jgi:hypothetical protein
VLRVDDKSLWWTNFHGAMDSCAYVCCLTRMFFFSFALNCFSIVRKKRVVHEDDCLISMAVMRFLDSWSITNYCVDIMLFDLFVVVSPG